MKAGIPMKAKKLFPVIFCLLALLLAFAPDAFPRAGSGQKYRAPARSSSGSGSSGGGSYNSGGSSNRTYGGGYVGGNRSYGGGGGGCCFGGLTSGCGGMVFLLVLIIVLIIFFAMKKKQQKGGNPENYNQYPQDSGGYYPPQQQMQPDVQALPPIDDYAVKQKCDTFRQKDPFFSEKVFLDKAQTAFFEIQRAWSRNDLEPVRKFMSEAQFNRMNMQLSEYKDKGWTNKVEDLVIGGIKIADVGIEGVYDFVKTRIHASLSDKTLDKNGKIVEGSNEIHPMAEYWTFIRRQGAKTNEDGGRTVAHNCPNCGAPVETGESGKCPYCETTLTAGSFDWVLDTITQGVEEMYE
jgi:predicted lipid-binding transport protein (Tim44 family)